MHGESWEASLRNQTIINESECYAELWMGTHPSGPSRLDKSLLLDHVKTYPSSVGLVPADYPSDDLPFLFKVLSVRTALSIQAHPDKVLAKELHYRDPKNYKDDNHKPEMAIALSDFECMCGFRSVDEIAKLLKEYPEFKEVIGFDEDIARSDRNDIILKQLFQAYMTSSETVAQKQLLSLITRLSNATTDRSTNQSSEIVQLNALLLRLHEQYPNDRGVFAPIILNYLILKPGESFFIGANIPHAYISGDCIECMALSDNVVRAGLTPKFKDVDTLCNMLIYSSKSPDFLNPISLDAFTSLYRPPIPEFEVEIINVPANTSSYHPPVVNCGSILLTFVGDSIEIVSSTTTLQCSKGSVLFIHANEDVSISTSNVGATFYRAHVNLEYASKN